MSPSGEIGIDKTLETGTLPYLSALSHPARSNSAPPKHAETDRVGPIPNVRFLLAFTSLSGSLPIPVFDQDKLGRSRENQISLPHDVYLSHSHCRFTIKRNKTTGAYEFYIEDLASRNGTTVQNAQIEPHKPVQLKHGTKVEIGGLSFVVVEVPMGN
jgi:pSer/pThr/pTyr-binding forkhead associated (FHA) protein